MSFKGKLCMFLKWDRVLQMGGQMYMTSNVIIWVCLVVMVELQKLMELSFTKMLYIKELFRLKTDPLPDLADVPHFQLRLFQTNQSTKERLALLQIQYFN